MLATCRIYAGNVPRSPDGDGPFIAKSHSFYWAQVCAGLAAGSGDFERAASIYEETLPKYEHQGDADSQIAKALRARAIAFRAWAANNI